MAAKRLEPFEQLEQDFDKWCGWVPDRERNVACSSGTAALHLALESLGLPLGSKVLVPDFTMIACARAVTLAGLVPVFVDCDENLLMDFNLAEGVIRDVGWETVAAIMTVDVYGRSCDMKAVSRLAAKFNIKVIQDQSENHWQPPYELTDAACWSFYKNKQICGEEGGLVAFRASKAAEKARCLRSLGFTPEHDFRHIPRGHNYRMSNAHAKLILKSLRDVGLNNQVRGLQHEWYQKLIPVEWQMPNNRTSNWVYDLRIPGLTKNQQDEIVKTLNRQDVVARHGFYPMSLQDEYLPNPIDMNRSYMSNALLASREIIYLPIDPKKLTRRAIETNAKSLIETVRQVCGSLPAVV